MTAAQWAERKAAGLCVWLGCTVKPHRHLLCQKHRKRRALLDSLSHAKRYMAKKVRGTCVRNGCRNSAKETSVVCAACEAVKAGEQRRYLATEEGKRQKCKNQQRYRAELAKAGKCQHCTWRPLVTETMCQVCREAAQARSLKQRRARGVKATNQECGLCKEVGHNRFTCTWDRHSPKRAPLPDAVAPTRYDYATARTYHEVG